MLAEAGTLDWLGGMLNSARRLCFIAYSTAINTRTIFSVSRRSASDVFPSLEREFTRQMRARLRTLVLIVVRQLRPVQKRS